MNDINEGQLVRPLREAKRTRRDTPVQSRALGRGQLDADARALITARIFNFAVRLLSHHDVTRPSCTYQIRGKVPRLRGIVRIA